MIKVFTIIALAFILYSCDSNKKKDTPEIVDTVTDSSQIFIDSAKNLLVQANTYVEKGIRGKMKKSLVNKAIHPIMEKFKYYYSKLKPSDTLTVVKFRVEKLNELIDLQMKYHPQN